MGKVPTAATTASVEDVAALIRQQGGRMTTPRRLLVESLLHNRHKHLTVEELAADVQTHAPDVHSSTIYRNLDELERLGIVTHAHLGHGPVTYQIASYAHAHFVCEECGARVDAPDDLFGSLTRSARDRLGFTIDTRHFAIAGRCQRCS
jgi:Fur family ferric uptake transcriptional regulator